MQAEHAGAAFWSFFLVQAPLRTSMEAAIVCMEREGTTFPTNALLARAPHWHPGSGMGITRDASGTAPRFDPVPGGPPTTVVDVSELCALPEPARLAAIQAMRERTPYTLWSVPGAQSLAMVKQVIDEATPTHLECLHFGTCACTDIDALYQTLRCEIARDVIGMASIMAVSTHECETRAGAHRGCGGAVAYPPAGQTNAVAVFGMPYTRGSADLIAETAARSRCMEAAKWTFCHIHSPCKELSTGEALSDALGHIATAQDQPRRFRSGASFSVSLKDCHPAFGTEALRAASRHGRMAHLFVRVTRGCAGPAGPCPDQSALDFSGVPALRHGEVVLACVSVDTGSVDITGMRTVERLHVRCARWTHTEVERRACLDARCVPTHGTTIREFYVQGVLPSQLALRVVGWPLLERFSMKLAEHETMVLCHLMTGLREATLHVMAGAYGDNTLRWLCHSLSQMDRPLWPKLEVLRLTFAQRSSSSVLETHTSAAQSVLQCVQYSPLRGTEQRGGTVAAPLKLELFSKAGARYAGFRTALDGIVTSSQTTPLLANAAQMCCGHITVRDETEAHEMWRF